MNVGTGRATSIKEIAQLIAKGWEKISSPRSPDSFARAISVTASPTSQRSKSCWVTSRR